MKLQCSLRCPVGSPLPALHPRAFASCLPHPHVAFWPAGSMLYVASPLATSTALWWCLARWYCSGHSRSWPSSAAACSGQCGSRNSSLVRGQQEGNQCCQYLCLLTHAMWAHTRCPDTGLHQPWDCHSNWKADAQPCRHKTGCCKAFRRGIAYGVGVWHSQAISPGQQHHICTAIPQDLLCLVSLSDEANRACHDACSPAHGMCHSASTHWS
jgi:hypothetical protein